MRKMINKINNSDIQKDEDIQKTEMQQKKI